MRPMLYLTFLLLVLLSGCDTAEKQLVLGGSTMGTSWSVKLVNTNSNVSADELTQAVQKTLDTIEGNMSTWNPESEVSRFNAATASCVDVSDHTRAVVAQALLLSSKSEGAFDVTVSPLIKRWGFGAAFTGDAVPTDDEIAVLKQDIGYQYIYFDAGKLCKKHNNVTINLSAIAKGYAVDQVADRLKALHLHDFLVEVGGELYAHGESPAGRKWTIGVEKPITDGRQIMQNIAIELDGKGLATSGDYRNFFERDGKRYSHIIDPVTGKPVTHQLASVTVLAESSMLADAWATTLLVVGVEKALQLAEQENLAVLLLEYAANDGLNHYKSSHWPK